MTHFWDAQQSLAPWEWVLRAVIIYFWMLFLTKIMGQRELGKLTIFDFIMAIVMGSITGSSLADSQVSMEGAAFALATLTVLNTGMAYMALKWSKARRVVEGEPVVVVRNGQILEKTMREARLNLDNLLMGLRKKNIYSPSDVEFAILESDGSISVIPKSQARPVTPADMGLPTKYEGLATVLVEDGNIVEDNLRANHLSKAWLVTQLRLQGVTSVDKVLAAILDTQGRLYVSRKNNQ